MVPPVRAPARVLAEVWLDGERGVRGEGRQAWRMVDRVAGEGVSLPIILLSFWVSCVERFLRPPGSRGMFRKCGYLIEEFVELDVGKILNLRTPECSAEGKALEA